mmetsp:Transcript_13510/g.30101  ORF Transcript_13510/g.30101 Transcript_13510/m.30101 type:complete len:249 (-) Transcript_13510:73-819(-)
MLLHHTAPLPGHGAAPGRCRSEIRFSARCSHCGRCRRRRRGSSPLRYAGPRRIGGGLGKVVVLVFFHAEFGQRRNVAVRVVVVGFSFQVHLLLLLLLLLRRYRGCLQLLLCRSPWHRYEKAADVPGNADGIVAAAFVSVSEVGGRRTSPVVSEFHARCTHTHGAWYAVVVIVVVVVALHHDDIVFVAVLHGAIVVVSTARSTGRYRRCRRSEASVAVGLCYFAVSIVHLLPPFKQRLLFHSLYSFVIQ